MILGLLYTAGLTLCIIPGIIVLCGLWMQYFLVLDQDVKVMDSFPQAWEFSKGNRMSAFLLGLLQMALILLGMMALCIGLLFTVPLSGLMWTVAYLMITGQPIARPST